MYKEGDLLLSLASWWYLNQKDTKPVKQILPDLHVVDHQRQISIVAAIRRTSTQIFPRAHLERHGLAIYLSLDCHAGNKQESKQRSRKSHDEAGRNDLRQVAFPARKDVYESMSIAAR